MAASRAASTARLPEHNIAPDGENDNAQGDNYVQMQPERSDNYGQMGNQLPEHHGKYGQMGSQQPEHHGNYGQMPPHHGNQQPEQQQPGEGHGGPFGSASSRAAAFGTNGSDGAAPAGGHWGLPQEPRRQELMQWLFAALDGECSNALGFWGLQGYAQLTGFEGNEEEWSQAYTDLCGERGWDPQVGCDFDQFSDMLNEDQGRCYASEADLQGMLNNLAGMGNAIAQDALRQLEAASQAPPHEPVPPPLTVTQVNHEMHMHEPPPHHQAPVSYAQTGPSYAQSQMHNIYPAHEQGHGAYVTTHCIMTQPPSHQGVGQPDGNMHLDRTSSMRWNEHQHGMDNHHNQMRRQHSTSSVRTEGGERGHYPTLKPSASISTMTGVSEHDRQFLEAMAAKDAAAEQEYLISERLERDLALFRAERSGNPAELERVKREHTASLTALEAHRHLSMKPDDRMSNHSGSPAHDQANNHFGGLANNHVKSMVNGHENNYFNSNHLNHATNHMNDDSLSNNNTFGHRPSLHRPWEARQLPVPETIGLAAAPAHLRNETYTPPSTPPRQHAQPLDMPKFSPPLDMPRGQTGRDIADGGLSRASAAKDSWGLGGHGGSKEPRWRERARSKEFLQQHMSRGDSKEDPYGWLPSQRFELVTAFFFALDDEERNVLGPRELHRYAQLTGFEGTDDQWDEEYLTLCNENGWEPSYGVELNQFAAAVNDEGNRCYAMDQELIGMLHILTEGTGAQPYGHTGAGTSGGPGGNPQGYYQNRPGGIPGQLAEGSHGHPGAHYRPGQPVSHDHHRQGTACRIVPT